MVGSLLAIYGVYLAAAVSPGPAVFFVMRAALGAKERALPAALGVATGTALWVAVAALGLSAVFHETPRLMDALRLAGGAYFLYLCFALARGAASADAPAPAAFVPASARAAYARGVATNAANPATALFFTGLFSLYDVGAMPAAARLGVYLGIPALSACWYSTLSLVFSDQRLARRYMGLRRPLDAALAALFLALGLRLLVAVIPAEPRTRAAAAAGPLLLPESLIVTYYGNPLDKRMGILGEIAPEAMMDRLEAEAALWAKADPSAQVRPALELVAGVASHLPQRDGGYRNRMPDKVIDKVVGWARSRGWLVILDVQVGRSTVRRELEWLRPYLEMPDVHLALDPEFDMPRGIVPGRRIGTSDAEDVNVAIQELSRLVREKKLPPKLLIVHRFTDGMLRRHSKVRLDPAVQVVVVMDGFGSPALKDKVYRRVITREPVQFAGIKLFYKNDKPMMTREHVLGLAPKPRVVIYQ